MPKCDTALNIPSVTSAVYGTSGAVICSHSDMLGLHVSTPSENYSAPIELPRVQLFLPEVPLTTLIKSSKPSRHICNFSQLLSLLCAVSSNISGLSGSFSCPVWLPFFYARPELVGWVLSAALPEV